MLVSETHAPSTASPSVVQFAFSVCTGMWMRHPHTATATYSRRMPDHTITTYFNCEGESFLQFLAGNVHVPLEYKQQMRKKPILHPSFCGNPKTEKWMNYKKTPLLQSGCMTFVVHARMSSHSEEGLLARVKRLTLNGVLRCRCGGFFEDGGNFWGLMYGCGRGLDGSSRVVGLF